MNRLVLSLLVAMVAAEESPFFKEILLGRCYDTPPIGKAEDCPATIGSILNVLESRNDADIHTSDFDDYLSKAEFSSPPDKALFVLHFFGPSQNPITLPAGFVAPENTAGGALLRGLYFCGIDQRGNCSVEKSNAYWIFWEAAYAKFASQATGHVQIVVEPMADIQFLQKSVVPHLQGISSVTIYGKHKGIDKLITALEKNAFIESVTYKDDMIDLYLDSLKHKDDTEEEKAPEQNELDKSAPREPKQEPETPLHTNKRGGHVVGTFFILTLLGGVVFGLYYFSGVPLIQEYLTGVKNLCMICYANVKNLCEMGYKAYFTKSHNNDIDHEHKSEGSPLIHRDHETGTDGVPTHHVMLQ